MSGPAERSSEARVSCGLCGFEVPMAQAAHWDMLHGGGQCAKRQLEQALPPLREDVERLQRRVDDLERAQVARHDELWRAIRGPR